MAHYHHLCFLLKHKEEGNNNCCRHLCRCNTSTEEDKTHKKITKKTKRREGTCFQASTLPSHFWLPLLPSCFCPSTFALLFQALSSNCHFCPPAFALPLLPFCFKHFLLTATFALLLLAPIFALPLLPSCFKLSRTLTME